MNLFLFVLFNTCYRLNTYHVILLKIQI
uniref:Uncharacterized protein n=1 Tax=Rhizophora mucronata TaxID=61149 RepID=A0A2P2PFV2_RHIMU